MVIEAPSKVNDGTFAAVIVTECSEPGDALAVTFLDNRGRVMTLGSADDAAPRLPKTWLQTYMLLGYHRVNSEDMPALRKMMATPDRLRRHFQRSSPD